MRGTSERITVLWNLVPVMLACASIVHSTENASPDQEREGEGVRGALMIKGGRGGEGCPDDKGRARGKGLG